MKKINLLICCLTLLLTSCTDGSPVPPASDTQHAQSAEAVDTDTDDKTERLIIPQKEYTTEELEQMSLNVGISVADNSINLKSDYPGRMLYISDTDTLFYMQDDKLYQQNGDSTIVLADIPALSLTLTNGKLYFIYALDRDIYYNYHRRWGTICCLDLSTGEIVQISDVENAYKIYIHDNTLYYTIAEQDETKLTSATKTYKMDMATHQVELINNDVYQQPYAISEKYEVFTTSTSNGEGIYGGTTVFEITNKITGEVKTYTEDMRISMLSVYGDKIYYTNGSDKLRELSIKDLSVIEYTPKNPWGFGNKVYILTYTIHNGALVITVGSDLQIWAEERNGWNYYAPAVEYGTNQPFLGELFSDGEKIYILDAGRVWMYIELPNFDYTLIMPDGETIQDGEIRFHILRE